VRLRRLKTDRRDAQVLSEVSCRIDLPSVHRAKLRKTSGVWHDYARPLSVLVISYSREDQAQIRQVVSLLKAAFQVRTAVFWDDDFAPGDSWFEQITRHIDVAPQLFVFWCAHSAASAQVRREFLYALEQQKRVVPVLLDDTALAVELAPIHGIDLRSAVRHFTRPRRSLKRSGTLAGIVALVIVSSFVALSIMRPADFANEQWEAVFPDNPDAAMTAVLPDNPDAAMTAVRRDNLAVSGPSVYNSTQRLRDRLDELESELQPSANQTERQRADLEALYEDTASELQARLNELPRTRALAAEQARLAARRRAAAERRAALGAAQLEAARRRAEREAELGRSAELGQIDERRLAEAVRVEAERREAARSEAERRTRRANAVFLIVAITVLLLGVIIGFRWRRAGLLNQAATIQHAFAPYLSQQ
jgi:hypothetical protein